MEIIPSLAQEAMILGVPSVVAYNGGTAYLASDEETALFYPPGDVDMCAHQIYRLLSDVDLSLHLSKNTHEVAIKRHNPEK